MNDKTCVVIKMYLDSIDGDIKSNLSKLNTKNVINMSYMFYESYCELTDISTWNTINIII